MKATEFINNLATQAGIPVDDADLKMILSDADLNAKDLSDKVTQRIQTSFLTAESAKQNPELKKHFTAQALNGVDMEIEELVKKMELPDDVKDILKAEKSSYKKVGLLAAEIKKLEAAKVGAEKTDKTILGKQISELNEQLRTVQEGFDVERKTLEGKMKGAKIDWELNAMYNSYNYALPSSKEANVKISRSLVEDALTKEGLKIVDVNGSLQLETKEGTEHFDKTNKKVGVKDYLDAVLAHNKVLTVTAPAATTTTTTAPVSTDKSLKKFNSVADNLLAESLEDSK